MFSVGLKENEPQVCHKQVFKNNIRNDLKVLINLTENYYYYYYYSIKTNSKHMATAVSLRRLIIKTELIWV